MLSVIALRNLLGFCLSSLVVLSGGSQVGVNPRFDDSSLKLSLFGKKIRLACNETFLSIKFCIECSSLLLPEELLAFLNRQTLLTSIFLLPQIATQRFQRRDSQFFMKNSNQKNLLLASSNNPPKLSIQL